MIKLIACDLDGTLLTPDKKIPEETFGLIEKLYAQGTVFAPASGRQMLNVQKMFQPVLDKVAIIAENGGTVWADGKTIFCDPTPADDIKRALDVIRGIDGLYPAVSCVDCAFYEDDYPRFVNAIKASYSAERKVDNLDDVIYDHTVIKISVWDNVPSATHGGIILPPLISGLRTMLSGYDWVDVSVACANKGRALQALMQHLGVERQECAAFGDHMNDYEMLKTCGRAYVTANAYPPLKKLVGEEIPSNADFGVIKKIKEFLI